MSTTVIIFNGNGMFIKLVWQAKPIELIVFNKEKVALAYLFLYRRSNFLLFFMPALLLTPLKVILTR